MSDKKESAAVQTAQEKDKKPVVKGKSIPAAGFCMYLGPTIIGVIQNGTIYRGTKSEVVKSLSAAIEKYPLIKTLIVGNETIAEDRIKVKTEGNILFVNYNKLAKSLGK